MFQRNYFFKHFLYLVVFTIINYVLIKIYFNNNQNSIFQYNHNHANILANILNLFRYSDNDNQSSYLNLLINHTNENRESPIENPVNETTNWQTLNISSLNILVEVYNAYYDNRLKSKSFVRIIVLMTNLDELKIEPEIYCQIKTAAKNKVLLSIKVSEYRMIWNTYWGAEKGNISLNLLPYLLTCPYEHSEPPISVKLITPMNDFTMNHLKVIRNPVKAKKNKFAVCTKDFHFNADISIKLIEWLELLKLLQASRVIIYPTTDLHSNVTKVFEYYQENDFLDTYQLRYPDTQPEKLLWSNELISLNDCLYRNYDKYEYIVLLDNDEIIIPKFYYSWKKMLTRIKSYDLNRTRDSYNFLNAYFTDDIQIDKNKKNINQFDDIPSYFHMLNNLIRFKNHTAPSDAIKSFHNTENILTLHNHFPFTCLNSGDPTDDWCDNYAVNSKFGDLHHYRSSCPDYYKEICENVSANKINDTTIWKYKKKLINNVNNVMKKLDLL